MSSTGRPRWRLGRAALAALAGVACASTAGEKGGLVPLDVAARSVERAHAPRRLALLVGIGQFDDPEWRPLRYGEKDAADLARVLRDPERGNFGQVEVLAGGATRAQITGALERLRAVARDEQDTVVVYLSSHGTLARDAHGALRRYLVARDTRLADVPSTALPMDELKADFERLRSRRKVLVLATCHSGGGKSLLPADVQRELAGTKAGFFLRPIEEVSQASVVLAACDWGETAREDEKLANDIYTHFLVEALALGADRNGDGAVTASEAHDYARRLTYEYTGGRQRPTAESTEVGADPIVLVGEVRRRGKPELYSYAPALDGFTLKVDGRPMADLPGGVALEPGTHRVQVAKGSAASLADVGVHLSPGERIDVQDLLAKAEGRWEARAHASWLGFLDRRSREDVLPPVLGLGASLWLREWPGRGMALRLDLTGSAGRASYVSGGLSTPYGYTAFTGGLALAWRFPVGPAPGLALVAGPRLSAVYLSRRFEAALAPRSQSYLAITPGLLAGAEWDLGRFTLGAESQLDWMVVRVDGDNRSSGFLQLLFSGGYRF